MIVKEEFLSRLRKIFDLNLYEVRVWTALLSRGVSTAGELSNISDVPRSRTYDILETLEKKGFIVMKLGKPIKFIALKPEEVIERVKKRIKEDAEQEEKILDELKDSELLQELTLLHSHGIDTQDPADITGSIRGSDNIYNHLEYQIKTANEKIVLVTTEEGIVNKTASLIKQLKKAKERGVEITIAAPVNEKTKEVVDKLKEHAQVIKKDAVNTRFCIVDNKNITVMLTNDKDVHPNYDLAVWMQSELLARTLLSTIE